MNHYLKPAVCHLGKLTLGLTLVTGLYSLQAGEVPKRPQPETKKMATPELTSTLLAPSANRQEAVGALALRGADGTNSAISAMKSDDAAVRAAGCEVIRLMPMCGFDGRGCGTARAEVKYARAASDQLSELLVDKDPQVRDRATQAIAAIGKASKESQKILFDRMQESDPTVSTHSAEALAAMFVVKDMNRRQVYPVVLELLKNPEGHARVAAVHMLNQMGKDTQALKPLLELATQPRIDHDGMYARLEAAHLLAKWSPKDGLVACKTILNEERPIDHEYMTSSVSILGALKEMGPTAKAAIPDIERMVSKNKAVSSTGTKTVESAAKKTITALRG